ATPGHTEGHTSLGFIDSDGRRVALAGDAIKTLRDITERRVDLEFDTKARSATSIQYLADQFDVIVPGHSPELHKTAHGWSQRELNKLELIIRLRKGKPSQKRGGPACCLTRSLQCPELPSTGWRAFPHWH